MWCACVLENASSAVTWVFFLFKQKTAYEMRISDWSSDVCSSDLFDSLRDFREAEGYAEKALLRFGERTIFELIEMAKNILQSRRHAIVEMPEFLEALSPPKLVAFVLRVERPPFFQKFRRSEERRVGN